MSGTVLGLKVEEGQFGCTAAKTNKCILLCSSDLIWTKCASESVTDVITFGSSAIRNKAENIKQKTSIEISEGHFVLFSPDFKDSFFFLQLKLSISSVFVDGRKSTLPGWTCRRRWLNLRR